MTGSDFLFDSSAWMALVFEAHPAHAAVLRTFREASQRRPACFCRSTQQSFLRLLSTPVVQRAYGVSGMTNAAALRAYEDLIAHPAIAYREEPLELSAIWPRIAGQSMSSPKIWMDAYLAAFAIAGDLVLVTTDHDFAAYEPRGLTLILVDAT